MTPALAVQCNSQSTHAVNLCQTEMLGKEYNELKIRNPARRGEKGGLWAGVLQCYTERGNILFWLRTVLFLPGSQLGLVYLTSISSKVWAPVKIEIPRSFSLNQIWQWIQEQIENPSNLIKVFRICRTCLRLNYDFHVSIMLLTIARKVFAC